MNFIQVLSLIIIFGLTLYIDYGYFSLLYYDSIESIIENRKCRLRKILADKKLRLFELQEKDKDKYADKILKLENQIESVVFKLNDLDKYVKED